jgi:hypothetical protein
MNSTKMMIVLWAKSGPLKRRIVRRELELPFEHGNLLIWDGCLELNIRLAPGQQLFLFVFCSFWRNWYFTVPERMTDDGIRFTVMSYNVLSPKLADSHQYLYEESDRVILKLWLGKLERTHFSRR